jgi:hypothetical protein
MIKYNWIISSLDCIPNFNGLDNVVTLIHWRYNGNKNNINYEMYGICPVAEPKNDNFTDFNNLSYDEIVMWLENFYSKINKSENKSELELMQNNILEQINLIENPNILNLNLPF